jgi:hypothetical protein
MLKESKDFISGSPDEPGFQSDNRVFLMGLKFARQEEEFAEKEQSLKERCLSANPAPSHDKIGTSIVYVPNLTDFAAEDDMIELATPSESGVFEWACLDHDGFAGTMRNFAHQSLGNMDHRSMALKLFKPNNNGF